MTYSFDNFTNKTQVARKLSLKSFQIEDVISGGNGLRTLGGKPSLTVTIVFLFHLLYRMKAPMDEFGAASFKKLILTFQMRSFGLSINKSLEVIVSLRTSGG